MKFVSHGEAGIVILSFSVLSLVQLESRFSYTEDALQNVPLRTCFSLNGELNRLLWKAILFMACLGESTYRQIFKHIPLILLPLGWLLTKLIESPYDKHTSENLIAAQVTSGKQKPKSHAD